MQPTTSKELCKGNLECIGDLHPLDVLSFLRAHANLFSWARRFFCMATKLFLRGDKTFGIFSICKEYYAHHLQYPTIGGNKKEKAKKSIRYKIPIGKDDSTMFLNFCCILFSLFFVTLQRKQNKQHKPNDNEE